MHPTTSRSILSCITMGETRTAMLNRDLLIIRLKQPFVDWINEADPYPDRIHTSLEAANEDCAVFLIHDFACEDIEGWLEQCYLNVFEEVLEQWYIDPSLWPQDRSLALFKAWCEVEVHGTVIDLLIDPLLDTDYED